MTFEYLRYDADPYRPDLSLKNQEVTLSKGGIIDIVIKLGRGRTLGNLFYDKGIKASIRKNSEYETYRFYIPANAEKYAAYRITAEGNGTIPPFSFCVYIA